MRVRGPDTFVHMHSAQRCYSADSLQLEKSFRFDSQYGQ
jgi:hypothetical protein